ncbi:STAS domain-containing protein [Oleiagrimonas sp. C23AA]|uniref:STAS domain-containing protein n=1 Tax=Oleiagrimonas sp. C23AA TaxID=2719047 RepID=UPI00141F2D50|nr:STAS domain-containing protein [Oleiagrimonas sp. C23AA]NII09800.1 STAS domain-containing protein [Oleiagrimonas sp. C23AA]
MTDSAIHVSQGEGVLRLRGTLGFATAAKALREGSQALAGGRIQILDLAGLEAVDSAGLACVLALMAEGRRQGHVPRVQQPPKALCDLARVCEVQDQLAA